MWPHLLHLRVADTLLTVGTDDAAVATLLQPWTANAAEFAPPDQRRTAADLSLTLHPQQPAGSAARGPRPLPTLQHGTRVIGRTANSRALVDGLLRTVHAVATPQPPGTVRLSGLPLAVDGGVAIAPPDVLEYSSHRLLQRSAGEPWFVPWVDVDPHGLTAAVPSPLGSAVPHDLHRLHGWWLAADVPAESPIAALVAAAAFRLERPWHIDQPAARNCDLDALAELVTNLPPTLGRPGR